MPPSLFLAAAEVEVGGYISIWKCAVFLIGLMIWARLLTWADKDAEEAFLPRIPLNLGMMAGLVLALLLFFLLPGFLAGLAAMVALFAIEVAAYLIFRQQKVGLQDLNKQFKEWVASFGRKGEKTVKAAKGETVLFGKGGKPIEPPEGENVAAEAAGYAALQEIITDPLRKRAQRIEMIAGEQRSTTRYFVDGMPYESTSTSKADASSAVGLLKASMGLDVADHRKPQSGSMKAQLDGKKYELQVTTAGSTAGESLAIEIDFKKQYEKNLDELGFSTDQLQDIRDAIGDTKGIVLLATPKGQGLTSLEYGILRAHDAFLTHIQTVERAPEIELEGITQNAIPANASPADEFKQVSWVVSQEPEVIMVSRLEDPRSAAELVKFAGAGKRAYIGLRAGSTFEALAMWRKLVGDDKLAMKNLTLIVAGRVVRKLCEACKMDYSPDPDTLRRLNMSPDRVGKLFTARTTPMKDGRGNTVVCEFCQDMHYKGRIGVYELFAVDDELRAMVLQGGSINQFKMLFKKQKRRYLQEQALARAVVGDTSLQEVARVLKATSEGGSSSGGTPSSGAGGGRPPSSVGPKAPSSAGPRPASSSRKPAPPAPRG